MHTILIVDDEEHIRFILSELLRKEGYKTILAENGNKAIRSIQNEKPDLVLLDYKLPDINGIEVLKKIQELELSIIVIMITAYGDIKDAVTSMKLGAYDYLTKPFNNDDILMIVEKSLKTLQMSREAGNFYRKISADESIKEMMGESKEIRKVLSQVELVADSDITVFLEGETGTGKDLIAKMIHHKSRRKNK
ncbi:MAG: sigma-54-dependent Fis family transcriptional regulator, partial [Candidatus Cloacimonetes bacterium]|nr:sigma-54-dependent Fis family transcriptional regulator [Candidatus Cloacimonadota bacterium]